MKKIYLTIFFFVLAFNFQAQEMQTTSSNLENFYSATLYVPITENKTFDESLQKAFSKYWKVTQYKLIDSKTYKKLLKENEKQRDSEVPKNFLFEWSCCDVRINGICFSNTFGRGTEMLLESHWLGDGSDSFIKTKSLDFIVYRLDYMIKGMNDIITYSKDNKLGGNNKRKDSPEMNKVIANHINTHSKTIKDKTLILNKDMKFDNKNLYDEKEFGEYYPYSFKFVSEKEFNEILKSERNDYACFIPSYTFVGGENHSQLVATEFVYEPATKSILYIGKNEKFSKIKKKDIENLKISIMN